MIRYIHLRCLVALLPLVLLSASIATAQLPHARLSSVFPLGAKTGSQVDVSIAGADLEGATQLYFSHAGITSKPKMTAATEFEKERPVANQFTVSVAANVPPGTYEAHVVGLYGISNPRAFVVSGLEEVVEAAGNNTFEKAQEVALGSTVNGRSSGVSFDWYKFTAKKGQRVLIDCWAKRLDSRMDGTLELIDANENVLASNRDANRSDPLLDFTAQADGDYYVKVYDFLYRAGNDYFYRLSLSASPYIDFVYPPAGEAGKTSKFTIYGRNLPGGSPAQGVMEGNVQLEKLTVDIAIPADPSQGVFSVGSMLEPRDAALDAIEYRLTSPSGVSNPVLVGIATAPIVLETEPNNDPAKPQKLTPPCEYVGQFNPRHDVDWVSFDAKKGDIYSIEVISQRFGLPTDPNILIQKVKTDDKGEVKVTDVSEKDDLDLKFATPGFDLPSDDPIYRFVANEDATYRILVRDLYSGSQASPRYVYRLAIRKEQPDFRLMATFRVPNEKDKNKITTWSPVLRKGETMPINVLVFHRDGFKGEIVLGAEGLPAGVTAAPVTVGSGVKKAQLFLTATAGAAPWAGPIKIVGKAKINDKEVVRIARSATVVWDKANAAASSYSRLARDITLAVTSEVAPISVDLGPAKIWETARAGKIEIPVKVVWQEGVKGNLKLDPQGLPKEIKAASLTINNKATDGKLLITIDAKAKPGPYSFAIGGPVKFAFSRNAPAVKVAEAEKVAIAKTVTEVTAADKQAKASAVEATKLATATAAEAKKLAAAVGASADAAKAAAQKTSDEAAAKAKAAKDAKVAADKAAQAAAARLKAATAAKTKIDKQATALAKAAKPKDIDVFVSSPAIALKIAEAPVTLAPAAPTAAVKQSAKVEIAVNLQRLFGYADPVDVQAVAPKNVKGLKIAKLTIAAGQTAGKIVIEAAKDATPGTHKLTLTGTLKFNGQNLTVSQTVDLKVEAVTPPKK